MLTAPPPSNGIDAIIDAALHHVEGQQVLRSLLAGKPWCESFGWGGGTYPETWIGNAKGIEFSGEIIRPSRIMIRAREYRDESSKELGQMKLF